MGGGGRNGGAREKSCGVKETVSWDLRLFYNPPLSVTKFKVQYNTGKLFNIFFYEVYTYVHLSRRTQVTQDRRHVILSLLYQGITVV
jgi:hypothetical protein